MRRSSSVNPGTFVIVLLLTVLLVGLVSQAQSQSSGDTPHAFYERMVRAVQGEAVPCEFPMAAHLQQCMLPRYGEPSYHMLAADEVANGLGMLPLNQWRAETGNDGTIYTRAYAPDAFSMYAVFIIDYDDGHASIHVLVLRATPESI